MPAMSISVLSGWKSDAWFRMADELVPQANPQWPFARNTVCVGVTGKSIPPLSKTRNR